MTAMTYLVIGENGEHKEETIASLKKKLLGTTQNSRHFDYEVFYSNKLDSQDFKEALLSLPTIGTKRVVLLRSCQDLNDHNRKIVAEFVVSDQDYCLLILEADELDLNSAFAKKIKPRLDIIDLKREKKANVFDMTNALARHRETEALSILNGLLADGIHPLQIMGGVVWFWRNCQGRIPASRYEKGLLFLQEADLNIKRSRLRPDYAVEMLVVQLGSLLN